MRLTYNTTFVTISRVLQASKAGFVICNYPKGKYHFFKVIFFQIYHSKTIDIPQNLML